jgi:hypothetical protein
LKASFQWSGTRGISEQVGWVRPPTNAGGQDGQPVGAAWQFTGKQCRDEHLNNTLTKIAEGHPINKIDQLMPWRMSSPAAEQSA